MHDEISLSIAISRSPELQLALDIPRQETPAYTGDYSVIPMTVAQILPTKEKRMAENLTVTSIPYYSVSNPQGGNTIFIGE